MEGEAHVDHESGGDDAQSPHVDDDEASPLHVHFVQVQRRPYHDVDGDDDL